MRRTQKWALTATEAHLAAIRFELEGVAERAAAEGRHAFRRRIERARRAIEEAERILDADRKGAR